MGESVTLDCNIKFSTLIFGGFEILMVRPRLHLGEVANDFTPPLFELPMFRNYKHGVWENRLPFFEDLNSVVS